MKKNCSNVPIILVGKTCSGKTTLAKHIEEETGLKRIVTYTTRKPRLGEKNGIDYHFISKEEFQEKAMSGFFAETASYNTVNGVVYYGSSIEDYKAGNIVILNPWGLREVKMRGIRCLAIYIDCPNWIIKRRVRKRGDDRKEFKRRYKADKDDFRGIEKLVDYTYKTTRRSTPASFIAYLRYNDLIGE